MIDLGSHGALAAGWAVLSQHKQTLDALAQAIAVTSNLTSQTQSHTANYDDQLFSEAFGWRFYEPNYDVSAWDFENT